MSTAAPAPRRSIAIVVQRYGNEVSGGAELHARWLAEHLLAIADVEVITTCAIDFHTWANEYEPGISRLNGVTVQRFPVDYERNWDKAQRQTRAIVLEEHGLIDEVEWIKQQGPVSTPLLNAIEAQRNRFDLFIFFTYLYATTYFGLPLVADKAILVPTAHEEPFLEMPLFRPTFQLPRVIVYNTLAERNYVNTTTHNAHVPGIVAGIGINTPTSVNPQAFRKKYGIAGDFVLFVGRLNPAKNVPELISWFQTYRTTTQRDITLVLAGKSHIDIPSDPHIKHVGFISEQDKFDGMQAASVFIIPSKYESLSMVALEAWLMETPTLVNGVASVMKSQSKLSGGGLYYTSEVEFHTTLTWLLNHRQQAEQMGRQAKQFVQKNYSWSIILAKYQAVFDTLL